MKIAKKLVFVEIILRVTESGRNFKSISKIKQKFITDRPLSIKYDTTGQKLVENFKNLNNVFVS